MTRDIPRSPEPCAFSDQSQADIDEFRQLIRREGMRLYRDLPWRHTHNPYAIWISEVMLQQTQVSRVLTRWERWLEQFPSVYALAEASPAEVLAEWQGMGYNRRALGLRAAAQCMVETHNGKLPCATQALVALPGIGPATAQGIRAFAFNLPGVYLETNVRTVFLHYFFPDVSAVPDREIIPLVEASCPSLGAEPQGSEDDPRSWYYALLDVGAGLKRALPNPSRRSQVYRRQSHFEGSRRQKRASVVRILLEQRAAGDSCGLDIDELYARLNVVEQRSGRQALEKALLEDILSDLEREGFCVHSATVWRIA